MTLITTTKPTITIEPAWGSKTQWVLSIECDGHTFRIGSTLPEIADLLQGAAREAVGEEMVALGI